MHVGCLGVFLGALAGWLYVCAAWEGSVKCKITPRELQITPTGAMPPKVDAHAMPPVAMEVPGIGNVWWHRGKGAKGEVDISVLPFRIAMDWSPKSGGKNFAGLPTAQLLDEFIQWYLADRAAAKKHPCLYEMIEDLAVTPTHLGVSSWLRSFGGAGRGAVKCNSPPRELQITAGGA